MRIFVSLFSFLFVLCLCFGIQSASAITLITDVNIDTATLARGYTIKSSDTNFNVIVRPGIFQEESRVIIRQLDLEGIIFPEKWLPVTDVYEYEVVNENTLVEKKELVVDIKTSAETKHQKRIFAWDEVTQAWQAVATEVRSANVVRTKLSQRSARLVVLETPLMELGDASWYKYKNCDCAASPDYPKGTKLRVKNLDNGKEVVVTVNDYGPDRKLFPNRVIDLDKVAFKKLGALSRGVLKNILVTLEKAL